MKKIITTKDMNLLKYSEVTKDFPILINIIKEKPYLDIEDIQYLDAETESFLVTVYPDLMRKAKNEWDVDSKRMQYNEEKQRCQLCNRSTRNLYKLTNKLNGNRLIVGPSCINVFYAVNGIAMILQTVKSKNQKWKFNNDNKIA